MRSSIALNVVASIVALLAPSCATQPVELFPRAAHPTEFWESIAKNDFALPRGESALALTLELGSLLGSRDPHLRDELGYEIAAAWIYRQRLLTADELREVQHSWMANLRVGIGEQGTDSVLLRSFSALCLSLIAARGDSQPGLSQSEFDSLLDAALNYLRDERDLRGWQSDLGWIHSCAHAADLLNSLARNRALTTQDQRRILDGIQAKLTASSEHVYTFGEDERLAHAIAVIITRADVDWGAVRAFVQNLAWACKRSRDARPFDPVLFATEQNTKHCLRALFMILSLNPDATQDIATIRIAILTAVSAL